jgi:hypothetical protein
MMPWLHFVIAVSGYCLIGLGAYWIGRWDQQRVQYDALLIKGLNALNDSRVTFTFTCSCMVCGMKRPDDKVDVISHDLSTIKGFREGDSFILNVRYCNDNLKCFEVAHTLDAWYDWPKTRKPLCL